MPIEFVILGAVFLVLGGGGRSDSFIFVGAGTL